MTLTLKPPLNSVSTDIPPTLTISGDELDEALQYDLTPGLTSFRNWLEELQMSVYHREKGDWSIRDWSISVGTGSQDLIVKVRLTLLVPLPLLKGRAIEGRLLMAVGVSGSNESRRPGSAGNTTIRRDSNPRSELLTLNYSVSCKVEGADGRGGSR